ncbi:DNA/RNA-binding protein KIN17, putative [Plasmodium gallinaceum]|uniref:DNA/RNA-binding protein KIN17, putative n=1 Tax=Plasmodium gallinaceum TaxID=5849 RepID=A0A1J1GR17_PLAGA|nr:DNA/RNA-binding protein KIN17, putative [Plasmodium gallinaceum]CRG94872.1 DNA/RNA-binding protein KIN17, putative [Plasmodium gallinaceum]
MPRAEPGTPKWLANKMKAKGLQKLKWYCQMCEKQCRDENGFKCHRLSETHQRQMQIFCQDANKFMDEYSSMFEKEFMRLMKTRFCRTRILANTVYTNLISDKTHIHMNATVWVTLTDFVLYLGKTGKCKIEQTERGWYLEYIDREKIEREKSFQERKKIDYSYEQLKEKRINKAIEEAKKEGKFIESEYTGIKKKNDEKIVISSIKAKDNSQVTKPSINIFLNEALKKSEEKKKKADGLLNKQDNDKKELSKKRPLSSLDLLILENEEKKKLKGDTSDLSNYQNNIDKTKKLYEENEKKINRDYQNNEDEDNIWICKNIVVKVVDKKHKYYNKKGVIISLYSNDKKKCEIRMDNKEIFTAYQKQLQTVIPKIGKEVLILKGKYKGLKGKIKKILVDEEVVLVALDDKNSNEIITKHIPYDDVSKLL